MADDVVREFIALTKQRRELEAELDPILDKLKALQPMLLDHFERNGIQKITADGMTAYLRSQTWAVPTRGLDRNLAIEALERAGLNDFVKPSFSTQSLSAYARELEEDGEELLTKHPELAERFTLEERFDVRATKA